MSWKNTEYIRRRLFVSPSPATARLSLAFHQHHTLRLCAVPIHHKHLMRIITQRQEQTPEGAPHLDLLTPRKAWMNLFLCAVVSLTETDNKSGASIGSSPGPWESVWNQWRLYLRRAVFTEGVAVGRRRRGSNGV